MPPLTDQSHRVLGGKEATHITLFGILLGIGLAMVLALFGAALAVLGIGGLQ